MDFTLSLPTAMDVSETVTVKNTFLDDWVTEREGKEKRRCHSVPRSWMPGDFCMDSSCGKSEAGEGSTTGSYSSDKEALTASSDLDSLAGSDNDFLPGVSTPRSSSSSDFWCLECGAESTIDSGDMGATPGDKPVVEVKLLDFVEDASPPKPAARATRTKLKSSAQPFASAWALPIGIQMVIQAVKDVLESDPSVVGVQMMEGAMGGTWTMVAHTGADGPQKNLRHCLASAKSALLTSAEHSQDTYIMGYDVQPFTKIDRFSFSATLASIPASQQTTACWDSYKNGFCPRRMSCRWSHPCDSQVMRLVIRVRRSWEPAVSKNEKIEKSEITAASPDDTEEFAGHLAMLQRTAMALSAMSMQLGGQGRPQNLQDLHLAGECPAPS